MLTQVNFHMTFAQVIMRSWLEFTGLGISYYEYRYFVIIYKVVSRETFFGHPKGKTAAADAS